MANTFLKAKGLEMGESLVEDDVLDEARHLLDTAAGKLELPTDAVIADAFANDANVRVVPVEGVPSGWRILDIGPETIAHYKELLQEARTIAWNGPMGVFEMPTFAEGTFSIARMLADLDATVIVGGGDSASAVREAGVADEIDHVSTGGGASLEYLEGKTLPGIAALDDK